MRPGFDRFVDSNKMVAPPPEREAIFGGAGAPRTLLERARSSRSTLVQTCEIARAHGGTLELEDSASDRTVFCLTLPSKE